MTNIVIAKSQYYSPKCQENGLNDYCYDDLRGYWVLKRNYKDLLINSKSIIKPTTKKADVETGEDKKGE